MPFMKTLRSSFRPAASPGLRADDLDGHSERPEESRRSARRRLRTRAPAFASPCSGTTPISATSTNCTGSADGELPLELRGGGVQVGVESVAGERVGDADRGVERDGRRVDAENDVGAPDRVLAARGIRRFRRDSGQDPSRAPRSPPPRDRRRSGRRPRRGRAPRPPSALDDLAEPVEVVGELARRIALAHRALPLGASRARAGAPRRRARSASAIAPSQSITTRSPGRISAPPMTTGTSSSPTSPFVAPCARTNRAQIGRPISTSSSRSRTAPSTRIPATPRACACVTSSSPTSATGTGSSLVSTSTSPGLACATTACTIVLSPVAQTRDARRTCDARAGHDLGQREVDDAGPAGRLVHGRDAEPREVGVVGHSASTTTGISRWNASA